MKETVFIRLKNEQWLKATGNRRRLNKIVSFMSDNFGINAWQLMDNDEFRLTYYLNPNSIPSLT